MRDDQIANPLRQRRPTRRHGVVHGPRLLERAPLGLRKAHEGPLRARMRERWPATGRHRISDIMISHIHTSRPGVGSLHYRSRKASRKRKDMTGNVTVS